VPEVPLQRIRPMPRSGSWLSLLSQNCKDGCRGLAERARGKKSKAANSVLVAFRNVLRPTVNELFQGTLHVNSAAQLFVLEPERNGPLWALLNLAPLSPSLALCSVASPHFSLRAKAGIVHYKCIESGRLPARSLYAPLQQHRCYCSLYLIVRLHLLSPANSSSEGRTCW
jgi:hypothetical protein